MGKGDYSSERNMCSAAFYFSLNQKGISLIYLKWVLSFPILNVNFIKLQVVLHDSYTDEYSKLK